MPLLIGVDPQTCLYPSQLTLKLSSVSFSRHLVLRTHIPELSGKEYLEALAVPHLDKQSPEANFP